MFFPKKTRTLMQLRYLTVGLLIQTNNIITGSNNITLRQVNLKSYGFEKMNMDEWLIEYKVYEIIDPFNERKITTSKFYSIPLKKIHPGRSFLSATNLNLKYFFTGGIVKN